MLFNIVTVLELMRDSGTFDPAGDPELLALAGAAAERVEGGYAEWIAGSVARLKSGARSPEADEMVPLVLSLRARGAAPPR